MKPFFGIDMNAGIDNSRLNSEAFIAKVAPEELVQKLDDSAESFTDKINRARLPRPLRLIKIIGGYFAIFLAAAFIRVAFDEKFTLADAIGNAPWLFCLGVIGAVACGVLTFIEKKRERKVIDSDETKDSQNELESLADKIFSKLDVPTYAYYTDIIVFRYVIKNGEIVPKRDPLAPTPYINLRARVFLNGDNLSIADLDARYDIPLSEIKHIRYVDEKFVITSWNKEDPFKEEHYQKFGMSASRGAISMRGYYVMDIEHDGELYGYYIPKYELPTFEFLLKDKFEGKEIVSAASEEIEAPDENNS